MKSILKVWKFLDESDNIDSKMEVSRRCGISYPTTLSVLGELERLGLIELYVEKGFSKVRKTPKFFSTRKNYEELWNVYDAKERNDQE